MQNKIFRTLSFVFLMVAFCFKTTFAKEIQSNDNSTHEIHLENLKTDYPGDNQIKISGEIFNESQNPVEYLKLKLLWITAAGNTVSAVDRVAIDHYSENPNPILKNGYMRKFEFEQADNKEKFQTVDVNLGEMRFYDPAKELKTTSLESKLGAGIGWPYGLSGVNYELLMNGYVALSGGLGSFAVLGYDDVAWSVGGRAYLFDPESRFRLRTGLFYGPAKMIEHQVNGINYGSNVILGWHPSLGFQWRLFRHISLDLDVEYVLPSETKDRFSYSDHSGHSQTAETNIDNYISGALGITYHFGKHDQDNDEKICSSTKMNNVEGKYCVYGQAGFQEQASNSGNNIVIAAPGFGVMYGINNYFQLGVESEYLLMYGRIKDYYMVNYPYLGLAEGKASYPNATIPTKAIGITVRGVLPVGNKGMLFAGVCTEYLMTDINYQTNYSNVSLSTKGFGLKFSVGAETFLTENVSFFGESGYRIASLSKPALNDANHYYKINDNPNAIDLSGLILINSGFRVYF